MQGMGIVLDSPFLVKSKGSGLECYMKVSVEVNLFLSLRSQPFWRKVT